MKKNSKDSIVNGLALIGGAVMGKAANMLVEKVAADLDGKIISGGKILLGFIASTQKNNMIKFAGFGMMAVGGAELAAYFIPSIGASMAVDSFAALGEDDTYYLNSPADGSILSDMDDMDDIGDMDDMDDMSSPADGSILSGMDDSDEME